MTSGSEQPPDDAGVPLDEAVRTFVDPSLLQRYDELCARIAAWPVPGTAEYRRGWPDEDRRSQDYIKALREPVLEARENAWAAVVDDLRRHLQIGELIASGFWCPLTPSSRREDIATPLWELLRFKLENSTVMGARLKITSVRIRQSPASALHAVNPDPALSSAPAIVMPRPEGIPNAIRAEISRRAAEGLLTDNWTQEAKALHAWATATFPGRKIAASENIRRTYRPDYDKARRDY